MASVSSGLIVGTCRHGGFETALGQQLRRLQHADGLDAGRDDAHVATVAQRYRFADLEFVVRLER